MSKIADSFFARLLLALAVYVTLIGAWIHAPAAPRVAVPSEAASSR